MPDSELYVVHLSFGSIKRLTDYRKRPAKRVQAARDLAKKVGVDIKQIYLTTGKSDLVAFLDAPSGDNVAKFALALSSHGNVHML